MSDVGLGVGLQLSDTLQDFIKDKYISLRNIMCFNAFIKFLKRGHMKHLYFIFALLASGSLYAGESSMSANQSTSYSNMYLSVGISFDDSDPGVSSVSGASLDEKDNGISLKLGMDYSDLLSFELGYRQYGNVTITDTNSGSGQYFTDSAPSDPLGFVSSGGQISLDTYAFTFLPKFKYDYTSSIQLHGGIGLMYFRTRSDLIQLDGFASTEAVRDFEAYYELGASYKINNQYSLNLDYQNVDDIDTMRIESTILSVNYRF